MALRYQVPVGDHRPCADADLVRPGMMRPPKSVEFRRSADMIEVAKQVLSKRSVVLDAAVGSGKSTLFPATLSRLARAVVLHVVPNPLLAADLFVYVRERQLSEKQGVKVTLWQAGDQMPSEGLVFMSSSQLVAYLIDKRSDSALKGMSVFLDEAHESDACTHLVRTLSLQVGAERLILASATFGPSEFRKRETPGQIVKSTFSSYESSDTWDIHDSSKPWCYTNITDTCLIFIDSIKNAARLERDYSEAGMSVYRLHSRMTRDQFTTAMAKIRNAETLVVVLADYSFRSGFTFEASLVIDTGEVAYYDPTPGSVSKMSRLACQFELEQAVGRVGRVTSGKVRYYLPDAEFPYRIYDLEGTEREAAAYLCRCMGFVAIGVLSAAVMAVENLPEGTKLSTAINALYPLTYYVVDSTGRSRTPSPVPESRSSVSTEEIVRDNKPAYVDTEEYDLFVKSLYQASTAGSLYGRYCYPDGLNASTKLSYSFPDGAESVMNLAHSSNARLRVAGLSDDDREVALTHSTTRYNLLNVEYRATERAIGEASKMDLTKAQRLTVKSMFEQLGEVGDMRRVAYDLMGLLSRNHYDLVEISPLTNSEDKRFSERVGEFKDSKFCYKTKFERHLAEHSAQSGLGRLQSTAIDDCRWGERRGRLIARAYGTTRKKAVDFVEYSQPVTLGIGAFVS